MALSKLVIWEVQTGGDDANGGGFKTGASGTDRSQQTSPQATLTAASTVHTTTTQINVAVGDFTVSAADVGNIIQITGGTATAGFYEITAVDVGNNRWTLDRSAGTSTQTVVGRMGGCLLTIAKPLTAYLAGQIVYVKSGTYTITSAIALPSGGGDAYNTCWIIGYGTTRGDRGKPLIQTSSAIQMMTANSGGGWHVSDFEFDGTDVATHGFSSNGGTSGVQVTTMRLKVSRCTSVGIRHDGYSAVVDCEVTDLKAGASWGILTQAAIGNHIHDTPGTGIGAVNAFNNIVSGAGSLGISILTGGSYADIGSACNNIVYNCGLHGIKNDYGRPSLIRNNIMTNNGGYGLYLAGYGTPARTPSFGVVDNNAFYSNTSGNRYQAETGSNDVTLSSTPFINAASGNFSLNNTSGGGAACRAAGFPGAFPGGLTTGYLDIGAAQHQTPTPAEIASAIWAYGNRTTT